MRLPKSTDHDLLTSDYMDRSGSGINCHSLVQIFAAVVCIFFIIGIRDAQTPGTLPNTTPSSSPSPSQSPTPIPLIRSSHLFYRTRHLFHNADPRFSSAKAGSLHKTILFLGNDVAANLVDRFQQIGTECRTSSQQGLSEYFHEFPDVRIGDLGSCLDCTPRFYKCKDDYFSIEYLPIASLATRDSMVTTPTSPSTLGFYLNEFIPKRYSHAKTLDYLILIPSLLQDVTKTSTLSQLRLDLLTTFDMINRALEGKHTQAIYLSSPDIHPEVLSDDVKPLLTPSYIRSMNLDCKAALNQHSHMEMFPLDLMDVHDPALRFHPAEQTGFDTDEWYETLALEMYLYLTHYNRKDPDPNQIFAEDMSRNRLGTRNKTCAIVYNSGSLLNQEHGSLIDSYDQVIRFNNAPTSRFEKWVGSKTSVEIMSFVPTTIKDMKRMLLKDSGSPIQEPLFVVSYLRSLQNLLLIDLLFSSKISNPHRKLGVVRGFREKQECIEYFNLTATTCTDPHGHGVEPCYCSRAPDGIHWALVGEESQCLTVAIFGYHQDKCRRFHYFGSPTEDGRYCDSERPRYVGRHNLEFESQQILSLVEERNRLDIVS